jgi:hypothetical protein
MIAGDNSSRRSKGSSEGDRLMGERDKMLSLMTPSSERCCRIFTLGEVCCRDHSFLHQSRRG